MEKWDLVALAQLLASMKDATKKLEEALGKKDIAGANRAKKEILKLKEGIDKEL